MCALYVYILSELYSLPKNPSIFGTLLCRLSNSLLTTEQRKGFSRDPNNRISQSGNCLTYKSAASGFNKCLLNMWNISNTISYPNQTSNSNRKRVVFQRAQVTRTTHIFGKNIDFGSIFGAGRIPRWALERARDAPGIPL